MYQKILDGLFAMNGNHYRTLSVSTISLSFLNLNHSLIYPLSISYNQTHCGMFFSIFS